MSTGLPREDAKIAFDRERRRRVLSRLASRLRFEPDDVSHMLPFDEVVAALGATSRVDIGEQVIDLDSIVGTVDRRRGEFDRDFRPSPSTRGRWERIAEARKRGEAMPPIEVFRVGDLHFVRDGHHRVSVARALREKDINARVTEVRTRLGADSELQDAGPAAEGARARVPRARAAPARQGGADPALRRVALRAARHARRVLGLPRVAGARAGALAPRTGGAVVRRGVRADPGRAARGRPRRRRDRDRALPADRDAALPAAADARLVGRDRRAAGG